jgi:hypothetical protein
MSDPNPPPRQPHPDPEVEALLHFEPVVRRCVRHDGWLADRQREFIIALTVLGHAEQAAHAAGGTMSGAYKLRSAAGGEGFAAAWDSALALHLRRNPRPEPKGRPSRGELQSGTGRRAWPAAEAPGDGASESEQDILTFDAFADGIFRIYLVKLEQERAARLDGLIVSADFYVRQLTCIEVMLDLCGNAHELLQGLRRGGKWPLEIVATPISVLLDNARRLYWAERGEPERPPLPPLGRHTGDVAIGETSHCAYTPADDGPEQDWKRREDEKAALAAEAQRAWEEKARADSEEWRKREAGGQGE